MSHWNYRIVRTDHPDWVWAKDKGEDTSEVPRYRYGVHEAYYDDADVVPNAWTVAPVALWADSLDGVRAILSQALVACDVEVLNDADDTT